MIFQDGWGDFLNKGGIVEFEFHLGDLGFDLCDLSGDALSFGFEVDESIQREVDRSDVGEDTRGAGRCGSCQQDDFASLGERGKDSLLDR